MITAIGIAIAAFQICVGIGIAYGVSRNNMQTLARKLLRAFAWSLLASILMTVISAGIALVFVSKYAEMQGNADPALTAGMVSELIVATFLGAIFLWLIAAIVVTVLHLEKQKRERQRQGLYR